MCKVKPFWNVNEWTRLSVYLVLENPALWAGSESFGYVWTYYLKECWSTRPVKYLISSSQRFFKIEIVLNRAFLKKTFNWVKVLEYWGSSRLDCTKRALH
jgi:hypothetical protein